MDHFLTMRGKGLVGRRPKVSLRSRPSLWICWFGCVLALLAIFRTFSHLAEHSPISLQRGWGRPSRPAILRPGQYRETVGNHYAVVDGIGEDAGVDEMGLLHDRRSVIPHNKTSSLILHHTDARFYRDENFYLGGTLTLTSAHSSQHPHPNPVIYDPYPEYSSRKWRKTYQGRFQPCLGPRGRDLDRTRFEDMVLVYKGKQVAFPQPRFGSHKAMDLDGDVCSDRYSRFGAYGYDDDSQDDVPGFNRPALVHWNEVDWNALQSLCFNRNADRYKPHSAMNESRQHPLSFELREPPAKKYEAEPTDTGVKQYHLRSAVLIRSWHNMLWTPNHREYLRAMIMELALHPGAEYEVFLLVHVKDDELPIFSDPKTMSDLRNSIPPEFRSMALFFNNKLLEAWYPKITDHR